jgi:hypothetical protein
MLTSMVGRNMPRPQLPSGAPPASMPGGGDVHSMIRRAMQAQPQGMPQMPQGMPQMPQGGMQPPMQVPPPMANPRNAMMGKILRG